jgi:hypothetical protein
MCPKGSILFATEDSTLTFGIERGTEAPRSIDHDVWLTPVSELAGRWKPWRTPVLVRPLEELPDLWAETHWARVDCWARDDCRLEGQGPGSRLWALGAARSSGVGPMNSKSMGRP